ncbi:diaminopimelate epimerase [Sinorhizobium sp. BJ1]|nr:diaminopimelate epimerase [Sinorhizobium sp. BJ1]
MAEASRHEMFIKMHSLENHFVIFDRRESDFSLSTERITQICDSRRGVGGEQLLTIEKPRSADAHAAMRIFNIDGEEVGACGNATRCVGHLLLQETGKSELKIETKAGTLTCRKERMGQISVALGPISSRWTDIPLAKPVDTHHLPIANGPLTDGIALSIGNPHVVFFVPQLDRVDIARYAPLVQNASLFPVGVNVGVAEVVDDHTLRLLVWERPGILTKACGTGACVAAFAAIMRGHLKPTTITVRVPAGELAVQITEGSMAILAGPVAISFRGTIEIP